MLAAGAHLDRSGHLMPGKQTGAAGLLDADLVGAEAGVRLMQVAV
ncbi:MAG TPA: hypothetical protein VGW98_05970 [Solirubrobacteraceae bacterium]|jgi:hypothetical protein|nr:hypothetical protein [Solirubrobacteraceae bacterium]